VQIGATQIRIHQDNLFAQAGETDAQTQGKDAFADAAFAAADAPQFLAQLHDISFAAGLIGQ
jgi:hypothetical protein